MTTLLPSPYRLYARDDVRRRVQQITQIEQFTAKLRWNDVSSWTLTIPYESPGVPELITPGNGIELRYDADKVVTGPTTGYVRDWAGSTDTITISGVSDDVWLSRRVIHPDPANADTPGTYATAYDVRGPAPTETIVLAYADHNLGPSAVTDRQVPDLLIGSSLSRGPMITVQSRFDNLLTFIQPLLDAAGLGIHIDADATHFNVEVIEPHDLTASVLFSRLRGNLTEYHYGLTAPTVTTVYGGGTGDGVARPVIITTNTGAATTWGRSELFQDVSSAQDDPEAELQMQQTLDQDDEQFDVKASQVGSVPGVRFEIDWKLGDKVTVVADNVTAQQIVRLVDLTLDKDGEKAIPFATDQTDANVFVDDATFAAEQTRRLATRLARLEAR